jgi:hypothetical protein
MDATEIGRRLAQRHADAAAAAPTPPLDEVRSLLNYAEAPHDNDWTLRSALVRLAQRDPARVGALLQVSRRLDAPLHHVARALRAEPAICDEAMAAPSWDPDTVLGDAPAKPYPDVRIADLARAVAAGNDIDAVLAGYRESTPLGREEELAVPLLAEAARFDLLARGLARWASSDLADPPLDAIDRVTTEVAGRLDELGIPEETGPPPRGARSRG